MPAWVLRLGVPIWISDPQQRLYFVNELAEKVLGQRSQDCLGLPCFAVVGGRQSDGQTYCRRHCSLSSFAQGDQVLKPLRMAVCGPESAPRWLQVMIIPIEGPDGTWPWLVHCAQEVGRSHRIERYVEQIAARNRPARDPGLPRRCGALTRRQTEVLDHLARDLGLDRTAAELGIRRVTVRNHVQHILQKLAVHSIQEAVAIYLTQDLRQA